MDELIKRMKALCAACHDANSEAWRLAKKNKVTLPAAELFVVKIDKGLVAEIMRQEQRVEDMRKAAFAT